MNIEEIRKNKPEGATHYKEWGSIIVYFKIENDVAYVYLFGDWGMYYLRCLEIKPL
ncbi:hypothetical protein [Acinetobacter phage vB_AbM_WUPSU]|nr:hypothetical protein [Acinetobacter phage vB_AbM_WUPSU]